MTFARASYAPEMSACFRNWFKAVLREGGNPIILAGTSGSRYPISITGCPQPTRNSRQFDPTMVRSVTNALSLQRARNAGIHSNKTIGGLDPDNRNLAPLNALLSPPSMSIFMKSTRSKRNRPTSASSVTHTIAESCEENSSAATIRERAPERSCRNKTFASTSETANGLTSI